jgi:hypothetical protein
MGVSFAMYVVLYFELLGPSTRVVAQRGRRSSVLFPSVVTNRKPVRPQSTTSAFRLDLLTLDGRNAMDEINNQDVLILNRTNHV